jgi:peroxiredoxin
MPKAALPVFVRLLRLGIVAELRNPAIRLLGVAGFLACALFAWQQEGIAAMTALGLAAWLSRAYGVGACLWLGYAAIRDQNEQLGGVLRSKPVDGAHWILLNWATGMGLWLLLLAGAFLGAALGQLRSAGAYSLMAHAAGFFQAAQVVGFAGTISFAMSRMMRSPLGGILTLLAWFCTLAGFGYIPLYLQPDYTQNRPTYLAAAALLLAIAGLFWERIRRGELRRPAGPLAVVLALLALTGAGATHAYQVTPKPVPTEPSIWDQISLQNLAEGRRIPGFWLPDGKGGLARTATYPGKVLVVYLFAGSDPEAGRALAALADVGREFKDQGVQPIGVCISADHGDGALLARTGGLGFPIGSDLSTVSSGKSGSAVQSAYDADSLPMLVITDRRRMVRVINRSPYIDAAELRQLVQEQLQEGGV